MNQEELHAAAAKFFGEGKSTSQYIRELAVLFEGSDSGARKWWYGDAAVPGAVAAYFRDVPADGADHG